MSNDIVEKFTTHLKNVLTRALCFVVETQEGAIRPEHLLWALGTEKGAIGAEVLHKSNIKPDTLRALIGASVKQTASPPPTDAALTPLLSENAKRAIEKAVLTASVYEHPYVGTEHLLSGLLQVRDEAVDGFFTQQKIDSAVMRQHLATVLKSASKFPELAGTIQEAPLPATTETETAEAEEAPTGDKTPALDYFGRDLTSPELQAKIDPVIGRDNEIQRLMEILCRRTKNNPLLLGEPGVGKTAIVEGLAKRIAEGTVPPALLGKRVIALDLALLLSGTMYRGEFEARIRQIVDEARSHEHIVLFIDEVHTIVGAGAATGSLDAANMLKPALARGDIRCIGATTPAEFKKHIETDAALERRFQPLTVHEPTPEDAKVILSGIATFYETYHGVRLLPETLEAAVNLSVRYIPDKFLPDKAIDLIDEASASVRVRTKTPSARDARRAMDAELARVREEKRQAVAEERYTHALALKTEEERIRSDREALGPDRITAAQTITPSHLFQVISRITGIPVGELESENRDRLLALESELSARVVGQDEAVRRVADAVRRAKVGIANPLRPLSSLLFLGPSGVGKTELARAIAQVVFQDPKALIQLDMSEFAEGYSMSKLLGSPAGYVGYREQTKLTDQIKNRPYSVVLFDEIEKAHSDVQNLLLQILENGEITDATGRRVSFRQAIIVLTSNAGLERLEGGRVGFASDEAESGIMLQEDLRRELEERFRPELVNRLDGVCVFRPLGREHLAKIAELQLRELAERLSAQGVELAADETVATTIAARSETSKLRAREIRRIIQTDIEPLIADALLKPRRPRLIKLARRGEQGFVLTHPRRS